MTIKSIRKSVVTKAPPSRAFALFATHIGKWWPVGSTIGVKPHVEIILEPFPNGRWFERDEDGSETDWGRVLVWLPPERLVLCWQVNPQNVFDPNLRTEVELNFRPHPTGGTEVVLEHRDIERFGTSAKRWIERVDGGWSFMLAKFVAFADAKE